MEPFAIVGGDVQGCELHETESCGFESLFTLVSICILFETDKA